MFELIALGVAGAAGIFGHTGSRRFVRRRLRFTKLVDRNSVGLGVAAGIGATVVAAPVVALLPIVGAGTALALGAGVGTGVAAGAKDTRSTSIYDDE